MNSLLSCLISLSPLKSLILFHYPKSFNWLIAILAQSCFMRKSQVIIIKRCTTFNTSECVSKLSLVVNRYNKLFYTMNPYDITVVNVTNIWKQSKHPSQKSLSSLITICLMSYSLGFQVLIKHSLHSSAILLPLKIRNLSALRTIILITFYVIPSLPL